MSTDLYTLPHKALRLAVSEAAVLLGSTEPATVGRAHEPVASALDELVRHAGHEDEFIEPLLDRFLVDRSLEVAAQHLRLAAAIDAVRRQLDVLAAAPTVEAGGPLALYRAFQRMAATNLAHLDYEETVVMPALWTTAPAAALTDVMAAFGAAHPEAAHLFRRWPGALTPTERATLGIAVPT